MKTQKSSASKAATTKAKAPKKTNGKKALNAEVTFEYFDPSAKNVAVAGSFNNWAIEKTPLKKDKSGRWSASISLPPGAHEYRFVVDGSWQNDQRATRCVQNPFGTTNCVIEVNSTEQ